jgi:hypothetical protein
MKLQGMAERFERPAWVRRLNAMGTAVGGAIEGARQLIPIEPADLLERATRSIGGTPVGDFGDPDWQTRFEELARAVDASDMHVVGRLLTKQELLRSLRTRLLVNRALDERPAMADERIEAPIIVTGPARSGTSILFELLWLDETVRGPLAWEALHPMPLPESAEEDLRPLASESEQELWADVQPEFAAMHELRSDLPVECVTLTAPSFGGTHWSMIAQLEGLVPDMVQMYAYHQRILQLLQHTADERTWLLKTPGHLMSIDLVFETYPDAWIVQTHRDPAKTMPSTVSTTAMIQWLRTDHVDVEAVAAIIGAGFGFALNSVAERRAKGDLPDRFVDVHFQSLIADPVAAIGAVYEEMGRTFTDAHARAIPEYLASKPKGKFGVHHYTPEEWGFSAEGLREDLAPYIDHFGVALE